MEDCRKNKEKKMPWIADTKGAAEGMGAVAREDLAGLAGWIKRDDKARERDADLGRRPLHEAVRRGWSDGVELMLASGFDPNGREKVKDPRSFGADKRAGRHALSCAFESGHEALLPLLESHGASYKEAGRDMLEGLWDRARRTGWSEALSAWKKSVGKKVNPLDPEHQSVWLSGGFALTAAGKSESDEKALSAWLEELLGKTGPLPEGGESCLFNFRMGGRGEKYPEVASRRAVEGATWADAGLVAAGLIQDGLELGGAAMAKAAAAALIEAGGCGEKGLAAARRVAGTAWAKQRGKDCVSEDLSNESFFEKQHAAAARIFEHEFFGQEEIAWAGEEAARRGDAGTLRAALEVGGKGLLSNVVLGWSGDLGRAGDRRSSTRFWNMPKEAARACAMEIALELSSSSKRAGFGAEGGAREFLESACSAEVAGWRRGADAEAFCQMEELALRRAMPAAGAASDEPAEAGRNGAPRL